ncbi:MAG: hypothetical protein R3279_02970 [Putridiphycobacter sp.]|nr:hypothetical protein [Putridiphycobacter sp.]
MLLTSKSQIKNYYIFVVVVGFCWTFFLPHPYFSYGILFTMLAGFLVFGINFLISFYRFKELLQDCDPFLFQSYAKQFGPYKGKTLNNLILFMEKDRLQSIRNKDFQYFYGITNKSMHFSILSFATIIAFVVLRAIVG